MAEDTTALEARWRQRARGSLAQLGPPLVLIGALLVLWQLATALWRIEDWLLPSPLGVLRSGWEARAVLWPHILQTTQETVLGFALALAVGLGLGLLVDFSSWARRAIYPILVVSQTIPTIAIAPLLVIWLGYGIWPKIIVVGLICFFPIVVSTADGLRSSDPELTALLRTMGATRREIFWAVRWPGALPAIYSGVRIAITYSVVGAILGEWVGASRGLGVFMLRASNSFRTDWVFATIAVTAALSILLFAVVTVAERLSLRWYYTTARQAQWEELETH